MAGIGCVRLSIGNTTPGVYRVGNDAFVVAAPGWDSDRADDFVPAAGLGISEAVLRAFENAAVARTVTDVDLYDG